MSLETDLLLDRRRLKRRLVFWRVLAVVAVVAALVVAVGRTGFPGGRHVARVMIRGLITEEPKLVERLDRVADDPAAVALMVVIDSPGGSVAGGESLHNAIARVAAKKPVAVSMEGTAASAGYMIAVPAQRIFAHDSTITGSIGVLLGAPEFSGLLNKVGIDVETLRSGPLKDEPSLTRPLSEQGRQVMQGLVNDLYDQFVAMVASGRHMDPARVKALADGRPYTGRQALGLGLIDAIGGQKDARDWLAAEKSVSADLPVRDLDRPGLAASAIRGDLSPVLLGLWKILFSQSLILDGPMALWQRSGN